MKRFYKLLVLAFIAFLASSASAYSFKVDGICYNINHDGTSVAMAQSAAHDVYGDVNDDGMVDVDDMNKVINVMLHKTNSGVFTVGGVSFTMMPVAGGTFMMGINEELEQDPLHIREAEKPLHQVTLSSYSIGQTEVTQGLWVAVMGSNPSLFSSNKGYIDDFQRPVECVNWDDCQEFITKLNELTGANFRLPTEAEWEYAARGGNKSRGTKFAGSNNSNDVAWHLLNAQSTSHPVATLQPNELGLYDMSGNVREWCQDWFGYNYYSESPEMDPLGPSTPDEDTCRVLRGGQWGFYDVECSVWWRSGMRPSDDFSRSSLNGLRLALNELVDVEAYADVNGDGVVDVDDLNEIINVMLGKPNGGDPYVTKTYTAGGVSFKMVPVAGGTFTMGATEEQGSSASAEEKPAHQVTVGNFSIGQTEVTQELWVAVMGSNPSYFNGTGNADVGSSHTPDYGTNLQRPVDYVSWDECQTFITKLNQLTGASFRLPTEAEWEYAARGGNKSQGYIYAGANSVADVGWYNGNTTSNPNQPNYGTQTVATKAPNELGLYDMSGNVCEWCHDWYQADYYSVSPSENPTGPESGTYRVGRGGDCRRGEKGCRVSRRDYFAPARGNMLVGLRLAL